MNKDIQLPSLKSCFSAQGKEIATDDQLAKEQFDRRVSSHNKVHSSDGNEFSIGDNVFLRNDRSKVRGREMYKVTDVYIKDEEPWLKLQKSENQFRAKTYDVKESEIIPATSFKSVTSYVP